MKSSIIFELTNYVKNTSEIRKLIQEREADDNTMFVGMHCDFRGFNPGNNELIAFNVKLLFATRIQEYEVKDDIFLIIETNRLGNTGFKIIHKKYF